MMCNNIFCRNNAPGYSDGCSLSSSDSRFVEYCDAKDKYEELEKLMSVEIYRKVRGL